LVPLNFRCLRTRDPMEEVRATLPLIDSIGAKMLKLEEVVGGHLETESRALAKAMAEYVLTCFQS
jgi:hypothetical protein